MINFDLSQEKLKLYYSSQNSNKAYDDIYKVMREYGFEHRQGSSYVSTEELTDREILRRVNRISKKLPWLCLCYKHFDISEVGRVFAMNHIFDKEAQKILHKMVKEKKIDLSR